MAFVMHMSYRIAHNNTHYSSSWNIRQRQWQGLDAHSSIMYLYGVHVQLYIVQMEICMFLGFINNRALEYRNAPPTYQKAHGSTAVVALSHLQQFLNGNKQQTHMQLCVKRVWEYCDCSECQPYTQLKMICAKARVCIKCVSVCVWLFKTKPQSPWHCHKTKNNSLHVKYIPRNWSNVSDSYIYCVHLWMHLNVCHPENDHVCLQNIFTFGQLNIVISFVHVSLSRPNPN